MLDSSDTAYKPVDNKVVIDEELEPIESLDDVEESTILDETLIKGSGLCLNMGALFAKRAQIYRRDIIGLFCEFFVPVSLFILGLTFVNNQYLYQSPNRLLSPQQLPLKQRIVMNSAIVN
jgi:hypothetical protein